MLKLSQNSKSQNTNDTKQTQILHHHRSAQKPHRDQTPFCKFRTVLLFFAELK